LEPLISDFISRTAEVQQYNERTKEEFTEFKWLHSIKNGILLGEKDMETSGGYAEYIVRRLAKDYKERAKIKRDKMYVKISRTHK
jgi:hypothetical protein